MARDLKSAITTDLNIPEENLTLFGDRTYLARVSREYIERVRCGKCGFAPSRSSSNDQAKISTGDLVEVLITALDRDECNFGFYDESDSIGYIFGKSFASTLNLIASGNKNGIHKELVGINTNCYCSIQIDNHATVDKASKRCACQNFFVKMFGHSVVNFSHKKDGVLAKDSMETDKNYDSHTLNQARVNLQIPISVILTDSNVYVFNVKSKYTVHDALMYSPAILPSNDIMTLFVFYQLLNFFATFEDKFQRNLSSLRWDDIKLDSRGWIKVLLPEMSYLSSVKRKSMQSKGKEDSEEAIACKEKTDVQSLPHFLEKWVCGEVSNFDYLMFLNKLAGRSEKDPNHHPILPWVSTLESEHGCWRDLTKSKYRLNKGDHQLDIQYSMMCESANLKDARTRPNLQQVPHHVPEFLSEITYYVYTARRTSKDVLCKLVRSYWEPNEYPASIQRMQEWTPDECIPEFYTDPSVFKSKHSDMNDLTIPEWCSDPTDFVHKHRKMLESDEISESINHWIDVTFGYKLSGTDCINEKNVCLPLVDNHTSHTKRGITQLFDFPHPKKRTRNKIPAKLPTPEIVKSERRHSTTFEIVTEDLQLLTTFDPRQELEELEKLLAFKGNIWKSTELSTPLADSLEECRNKITRQDEEKTLLSDQNVVALLCLMIELYLPLQTRTITREFSFAERFKCCLQCFKLNKSKLPAGIQFAMEYFIRNFKDSEEETIKKISEGSKEFEIYFSIFKTVSDKGLPPPSPVLLCSRYIHIFPFPPYFQDLYDILQTILVETNHYSHPLSHHHLRCVTEKTQELFENIHETEECLKIFVPHIQQLLKQRTNNAAQFLLANYETISKAMGIKISQEVLFPPILRIFEKSLECDFESGAPQQTYLTELYGKPFLLQLSTRLGLKAFLENIPRCLADALIVNANSDLPEISHESICWLMERIGPTLTSKYIIRHLFRVLTKSFILENDTSIVEVPQDQLRKIFDCLTHAAELFGTPVITLQYFAHLIHSISSAIEHPKYAPRHQAAVEASIATVTYFIAYLTDIVLMEQLSRISKEMIIPVIELLGRSNLRFYGGPDARKSLCLKVIHLMALIVIRIGREMAREHLNALFQTFFSYFCQSEQISISAFDHSTRKFDESFDSDTVVIGHDSNTKAIKIGSVERSAGIRRHKFHRSWFNDSPTSSPTQGQQISTSIDSSDPTDPKQEISATFCAETAYCSYVSFTRLLGDIHMERILGNNHDHVWTLSLQHENTLNDLQPGLVSEPSLMIRSNYQSDITMVGNRLIVAEQTSQAESNPPLENDPDIMSTLLTSSGSIHTEDLLGDSIRRNLKAFPASQLTENWLAYWEHEIGLPENDRHIHFNQIELQSFTGHTGAVRCVACHPSEEWFVSGGKDKMVKIWSLWGDNETQEKKDTQQPSSLAPSFVYKSHKKTVTYTGIVETEQLVISNDGNIHVWDPYTCHQIQTFDSSDVKTGFALVTTLQAPQRYALTVTNEADLRFIDFRRKYLAHEFKTMVGNSIGIVRAMCASSDSNRVAVGFSTGMVTTIDIRIGTVLSMKPAHEADISAMATVSEKRYITASADQTVAMWEFGRSTPLTIFRSFQEPVHTVEKFNDEMISASVANRVLVHALPGNNGSFDAKSSADKPIAVSKLRSDSFKGTLTTLSVLPMKRQILLGSDNGNIKLMA